MKRSNDPPGVAEDGVDVDGKAAASATDADEVVDALRRDLQDGEDLALAMQLVADALDRRLARVRRSLVLAGSAGSSQVGELVDRLRRQVDEHRATLDQHRSRLQYAVDDVQRLMDSAADELEHDDA